MDEHMFETHMIKTELHKPDLDIVNGLIAIKRCTRCRALQLVFAWQEELEYDSVYIRGESTCKVV